jgi:L-lactate dehydrogenase complex protein LldF
MLRDGRKYHDNVSACSLCCSCDNVCPAKVNLSEQIYDWRQTLKDIGRESSTKKFMSWGMKTLFDRPGLYNTALKSSPLINAAVSASEFTGVHLWGKGRRLPQFAKESFHTMWAKGKVKNDK